MVGRNNPCWCGSGKKYKKCHMNREDDQPKSLGGGRQTSPYVKSPEQIEGMRRAGMFNGELMDFIRPHVTAGVTTEALDKLVHEYTLDHGHTPACLGYRGYPKSICTSINNVVCHGIPSPKQVLSDGDIINVDLTTIVDGFFADSSETFMIGEVDPETKKLVLITARALMCGIDAVKPGVPLSAIAAAIEPYVNENECSVVHQYTGHGVGTKFHEHFTVYHHVTPDCENVILEPGMTFTIEPMVNKGDWKVVTDRRDGWTVRTADGSLSAQYEHTIAVSENGAEILTLTPGQKAKGVSLIVGDVTL